MEKSEIPELTRLKLDQLISLANDERRKNVSNEIVRVVWEDDS